MGDVNGDDPRAELEPRARAYLHTNCATCHRRGGGGTAAMDIRYAFSLKQSNLLGARPTQGTFGMLAARVMAPGAPYRSVLLYRMAKLGRGRMPHFGSQVVDVAGLNLVHDWIASLPSTLTPPTANEPTAVKLRSRHTRLINLLGNANLAGPAQLAALEELLSSSSGALQLVIALGQPGQSLPASVAAQAVRAGGTHADIRVRDLFERFLPDDQRIKRLGTVIRPETILALDGSADKGRQLFLKSAGVQCRNCHRVAKQGHALGPDLDEIGKKNDRRVLLETILEPSRKIAPKYRSYIVETVQGRVYTGLLVSRSDKLVVLKDSTRKEIRVPADEVEMIVVQAKSLMPELLLKEMTAQQVADLLAFLQLHEH